MNEPAAADVMESPLKNSRNGTDPPTKPITTSLSQLLKPICFRLRNSLISRRTLRRSAATTTFFRKVNVYGSIFETLYLLINIENPLMMAVATTSQMPPF